MCLSRSCCINSFANCWQWEARQAVALHLSPCGSKCLSGQRRHHCVYYFTRGWQQEARQAIGKPDKQQRYTGVDLSPWRSKGLSGQRRHCCVYYFTRGWPWESGSGTISLISGGDFCIDFTLHPSFLALPFTLLSASFLICSHHAWLPHSASCTLALLCHCSARTTSVLQTTPQVPTALHAQQLSFKTHLRYPLLCTRNSSPSNHTPGTHCSACTTALLQNTPQVPTALHAQQLSFKKQPRYPLCMCCIHNSSPSKDNPGTHCTACIMALLQITPKCPTTCAHCLSWIPHFLCTMHIPTFCAPCIPPLSVHHVCTMHIFHTPTVLCAPCVSFTPLLLCEHHVYPSHPYCFVSIMCILHTPTALWVLCVSFTPLLLCEYHVYPSHPYCFEYTDFFEQTRPWASWKPPTVILFYNPFTLTGL